MQSGFADGDRGSDADTPAGHSVSELPTGSRKLAWWGRVSPHLAAHAGRLRVRWIPPTGDPLPDQEVKRAGRGYVISIRDEETSLAPGQWTLECRLDEDVVDRRTQPVLR